MTMVWKSLVVKAAEPVLAAALALSNQQNPFHTNRI